MKKRWFALGLSLLMLLSVTACQKDTVDDTKPQTQTMQPTGDIIPGVGDINGQSYALRRLPDTGLSVEAIYGIENGWINVYGTYQEERGFFFVNEQGKVLNDAVFDHAYSFEGKWAYVREGETWYQLGIDGNMEITGDPNNRFGSYERRMIEIDGEERWYVYSQFGGAGDPIFSWIESLSVSHPNYAVLADAEHPQVLIDETGEVLYTLPDDCRGASVGESGMVGKFYAKDSSVLYRPLDRSAKVLGEHSFEVLTQQYAWVSAGSLDGYLTLLDEKGDLLLKTDVKLDAPAEKYVLEFDGETIAYIDENGHLQMMKLERSGESLRQVALDLVDNGQRVHFLYLTEGGYDDGKSRILPAGTEVIHNGETLVLDYQYSEYHDTVLGYEIHSMEDLHDVVKSVYTEALAREEYYPNEKFVEHEGVLYVGGGGAGYLPWRIPGSVQIIEQSENTVVFQIEEYIHVWGDGDINQYTMVKTADGWRLDTDFPGEQVERD